MVVVGGGRWAWAWAVRREGSVSGSFWADGSCDAPVSFWTTCRKFDGSACTKVVFGCVVRSDPYVGECMVVEREREREIIVIACERWLVGVLKRGSGKEGMKYEDL